MMDEVIQSVQRELFGLQDVKYRDFQGKLIPTVDPEAIIGVRTPALRALAKELTGREYPASTDCRVRKILFADSVAAQFIRVLPHQYFDENQLHAFILSEMKDYDECIKEVDRFLPFIDNWATCDQLSPKVFRKHKQELLAKIYEWLGAGTCDTCGGIHAGTCDTCGEIGAVTFVPAERTYTVRFAVGMLMQHFLDEDFDESYLEVVSRIRSDEYYVNMMTAWYFATALAKQYDAALPYIEKHRLDQWTHNKAIQKSIESRRISDAQKSYLRSRKY